MVTKKMTEQNIRDAVLKSKSIAECLKKMGMSITTANYRSFHKAVKQYELNTSHFLGQAHLKDQVRNINTTIPLDQILIKDSSYLGIAQLKKRLIKNNLLSYKCDFCKITTWNNKPISLQLDHINVIHNDHRLENLRFLCPNCHSQTNTFAGRNKTNHSKRICECGNEKRKQSNNCRSCASKKKEEIKRSLRDSNTSLSV